MCFECAQKRFLMIVGLYKMQILNEKLEEYIKED